MLPGSFYMTQLAGGLLMHLWPAIMLVLSRDLCKSLAYTLRISHEALAASFSVANHSMYEVR